MAHTLLSARHRNRDPTGPAKSALQIVSTSGCLYDATLWRDWAGAGDLQTARGINGRENLGRERLGEGSELSFHDPGERCHSYRSADLAKPSAAINPKTPAGG